MGENSKIEWCDHTFNPWSGCQRVSPGCQHCYAETMAKRNPKTLGIWGPTGTRVRTRAANWRKPLQWDKQAKAEGRRYRVFCASMADVFEDRPELVEWRRDLFNLIAETVNLDWLLLTKRPENIMPMLIRAERGFQDLPSHIWIGATVENQEQADRRIPELLAVPAAVRFLSCEPLLGPVDLRHVGTEDWDVLHGWKAKANNERGWANTSLIHWVIAGGESGHGARPAHPDWFRSLRDQCRAAGVPYFMKQGSSANWENYKDFFGFPSDLQIREFPNA